MAKTLQINIVGDPSSFSRAMRRVEGDADKAGKKLSFFTGQAEGVGDAVGGVTVRMGLFSGSVGKISAIAATATPALVALGGAAAAVGGSMTAAAGGAAALGTGLAASLVPVLAVGKQVSSRFDAIKTAYDALEAAQDSGARTAVSSASTQTAAARQIEGAQRSLGDAERSLGDAHRSAEDAQESLTDARAQARRELVDLKLAAEGAAISEERASLTLQSALRELRRATAEGSEADIMEAQNEVDSARLSLREARVERTRTQADAKRGTDTVTDAQNQLAAARARVADAERGVADAQRSVAEAQEDAAAAVANVSGAVSTADVAMSKLSKAERAAVKTFQTLARLQDHVLGGASDRIILAFSAAVNKVAPMLETLAKPFDRLGDAIAKVIEGASRALVSPEWAGALRAFVNSATGLIGPFSRVFGAIANIMRDVAVASLPLVRNAVGGVADSLWRLDSAATRSKIRGVVLDLVQHTKAWWELTEEVGELVFRVFNTGAKSGRSLISSLTGVIRGWNQWLGTREGQRKMRDFMEDSVKTVRDLARVIAFFGGAAVKASILAINAFEKIRPAITLVLRGLTPIIGLLTGSYSDAWRTAKRNVAESARAMGGVIHSLAGRVGDMVKDVRRAAVGLGKAIVKGIATGIKDAATGKGNPILGAITNAIPGVSAGKVLGKLVGDGLGKRVLPSMGAPGLGGGSLDGADPDLAPFAAVGARFGLSVSSGLRPGDITSSGNPSFHGTGDAIDMYGPPGGMMATFRYLKKNFSGRLRELIYTPGGTGVKDGRPFRYTGQVAADHFDHVHVAYTGPFGDGVGTPGSNAGTVVRVGRKVGASMKQILAALATILVESGGRNVTFGDRDSEGAFQQRPSQGWGPASESLATDAGQFFAAIKRVDQNLSIGEMAQAVQRSAFPARYSERLGDARALLQQALGGGALGASGGGRGAAKKTRMGQAGPSVRGGGGLGLTGPNSLSLGDTGDVARAQNRQARAQLGDNLGELIAGLGDERKVKMRQLKRIRKLLKGRLSRKRRIQLIEEETRLVDEIGDLNDTLREYKADAAHGAKTISRAEELDAGIDTNAGSGESGSSGSDAALELSNRLAEERNANDRELIENQKRILALAGQGPAILASIVAAVNGGIGGPVGLGFSTPAYAGMSARY